MLLAGPRGSGKTSMLRQAQLRLRDSGRRVVYVDASAIDSAASLASRLRAGLTGSYGPPIEQFAALPDVGRGAPALPGARRVS